ncbi:MAG: hypothetical protein AAFU85_24765 [Planctomycetota bacterium]
MVIPMWLAKSIAWLGIGLMLFAVVDVILRQCFDVSLTGSNYGSAASFGSGFLMRHFGEALDEE